MSTILGFIVGFIIGSVVGIFSGVKIYRAFRSEFGEIKCICRFCGQNMGWLTK